MADTSLLFLIINLIIIIVMAFLLAIIPFLTRRNLFFGIRIPSGVFADSQIKALRSGYVLRMSLAGLLVVILAIVQYLLRPELTLLSTLYLPLILLVLQLLLYLPRWRKTRSLKQQNNWQPAADPFVHVDPAASRQSIRMLPWGWYIVSSVLVVIGVIWSYYIYADLPETIITHWNAKMEPDAWKTKSYGMIWIMPIITLVMILIMLGSNILIYRTRLQVSQENRLLSLAQHRKYRLLSGHMLGTVCLLISMMMMSYQPMIMNYWVPSAFVQAAQIIIFTALMLVPPILLQVKAGQSGCKLKPSFEEIYGPAAADHVDAGPFGAKPAAADSAQHVDSGDLNLYQDRSDDNYWFLGLFYHNPKDPSILVEDRFGMNGGLNFARRPAKIIACLLALFVLLTIIFTTVLLLSLPL